MHSIVFLANNTVLYIAKLPRDLILNVLTTKKESIIMLHDMIIMLHVT